eukprot:1157331-Pelagomonas_calceolata.AAC.7
MQNSTTWTGTAPSCACPSCSSAVNSCAGEQHCTFLAATLHSSGSTVALFWQHRCTLLAALLHSSGSTVAHFWQHGMQQDVEPYSSCACFCAAASLNWKHWRVALIEHALMQCNRTRSCACPAHLCTAESLCWKQILDIGY